MTEPPGLNDYLTSEGATLTMRVTRTDLARAGEESFTTVSEEAVAAVADQAKLWIVSRLLRTAQLNNAPPPQMGVTITATPDTGEQLGDLRFVLKPDSESVVEAGRSQYSKQLLAGIADRVREWLLGQLVISRDLPQLLTLEITAGV